MELRLHQVDAFTRTPFKGNPAAVAILAQSLPDSLMQSVAAEMNLSETAFITPRDDGTFALRWFTPTVEVDLCGHATLASAHVLWEHQRVEQTSRIRFETLSGRLEASQHGGLIRMDFPAEPAERVEPTGILLDAVRADVVAVSRSRLDYLVELSSEDDVRSLQPELSAVAKLGSRGLIVTARSANPDHDFISRYFAPQFGIPEDPVTGSAHCTLAPYWVERLGRDRLTGYQASARGGVVYVELRGDRVSISGHAVLVATIELLVDADP